MGYKVKKIYVGTEKVRPATYEYSYDFRNKTISGMQSGGWTFASTSGITINSEGLQCSSENYGIYCQPSNFNLNNANKITLNLNYKKGTDTNYGANTILYLGGPSSYNSNGTGIGSGYQYINGYVYSLIIKLLGGDGYRGQYTVSNSVHTITETIDLVNKTIRFVLPGVLDKTITLTDAQISTIRTLKYIRVGVTYDSILKYISVIVE